MKNNQSNRINKGKNKSFDELFKILDVVLFSASDEEINDTQAMQK